jgi:hypothetical protein
LETSGFEQGYNLSYQISNAHYFGETKVNISQTTDYHIQIGSCAS